jgi:hypothetical protein
VHTSTLQNFKGNLLHFTSIFELSQISCKVIQYSKYTHLSLHKQLDCRIITLWVLIFVFLSICYSQTSFWSHQYPSFILLLMILSPSESTALQLTFLTGLPAGTITVLKIYFQLSKIKAICHFWTGWSVAGKIYLIRPTFLLASIESKRKVTEAAEPSFMYHKWARLCWHKLDSAVWFTVQFNKTQLYFLQKC